MDDRAGRDRKAITESEPVSEEESATNCELGCRGQAEQQRESACCVCLLLLRQAGQPAIKSSGERGW